MSSEFILSELIFRKLVTTFMIQLCALWTSDSMVFGIYFYFEKKKSVMQEKLGEVFLKYLFGCARSVAQHDIQS